MKDKMKYGVLALVAGVVMSSQAFAVTYEPNIDESVKIDKIEALDEVEYTQADADRILEVYMNGITVSDEEFAKYDIDKDGKINANDAALVLDMVK